MSSSPDKPPSSTPPTTTMNLSGSNNAASPISPSPLPSSDEYKPFEWAAEPRTGPCSTSSLIEITRTSKKDRAMLLDGPEMTIPRQLQIFSMHSIGSEQNLEDKDHEIRQLKRKVRNLEERLADFTAAASGLEQALENQAAEYDKQKKHLEEEMRKGKNSVYQPKGTWVLCNTWRLRPRKKREH
ncbi:hypothetical protein BS50DRAFT_657559 [Corynespora cassiicola Philippines]|uniref:Uncharacterized protein n=1 Tax=Corynespora cassiicola Philippines TaxID=1448308 RepID=A0A2T2P2E2_CORCC|nr:hypothetical protein BS50DRAFT_657559 [Corynespora cassiicola Philippines]